MSEEDVKGLSSLLDSGFSFTDALTLMEEDSNREIFNAMRRKLEEGERISDFFSAYCPKSCSDYLIGFMEVLPFGQALKLSLRIEEELKKRKEKLVKGLFYPIALMVGMVFGIMLFNHLILPNMMSLMKSFKVEQDGLDVMAGMMEKGSLFLFFLTIIAVILAMFLLSKKRIRKTYAFFAVKLPGCLLVQTASETFARFYLECVKLNMSTKDTMEMLKNLENQPLASFIAKEVDASLLKGDTLTGALDSPYVENALLRFMKIALYTTDAEKMLEGYLNMTSLRTDRKIKNLSRAVQLVSYSMIGGVLIFVYQVLMLPMSLMQQI